MVETFDGLWQGILSANATKLCHLPETYVAIDVDHAVIFNWHCIYPICHELANIYVGCVQ